MSHANIGSVCIHHGPGLILTFHYTEYCKLIHPHIRTPQLNSRIAKRLFCVLFVFIVEGFIYTFRVVSLTRTITPLSDCWWRNKKRDKYITLNHYEHNHTKRNHRKPMCISYLMYFISLQWSHNECDGVSNHNHLDYLFNRLFRRRSKKTSKRRVTGLWEGDRRIPRTWHHHVSKTFPLKLYFISSMSLLLLIEISLISWHGLFCIPNKNVISSSCPCGVHYLQA